MEMNVKQKAFTCIGKGHGAPCFPANREEWEKLRREAWLKEMCARIERGDEQLKHRLPVWTPHCAEFKNNHRAIADAVRPLNRLMLDFDEKGHTMDILSKLGMSNEKLEMEAAPEIGGMTVLLVEESVRRGTHVLVELPEGMTAEQAQELMKEATGFEPDAAVKDVSRCIYMVTEEHTKYVSERLFEQTLPQPLPVREGSDYSQGEKATVSSAAEHSTPLHTGRGRGEGLFPTSFKGVPYAAIIAEYWQRMGGRTY